MSLESLRCVIGLLMILQFFGFGILVGVFIGRHEEITNIRNTTWKDVFDHLIIQTLGIFVLQLIMAGITWSFVKSILVNAFLFSWGFRAVALASFMRVLWPDKAWWSETEFAPRYPRLKLFIYSLLALGLSFIPVLLNLR